jgi:hypothetical protein
MGRFKIKDETGNVYSRLTVIGIDSVVKHKCRWLCKCECGNTKSITGIELRNGKVRSCGCLRPEIIKTINLTHGHLADRKCSKEYRAWQAMKARCFDINNIGYPNYGGQGKTVCDRWKDSFENFFADMGKKPTPKHSLDRIDNKGNYEPSNCRWATRKEQQRNTSRNNNLELNGITMCISDWAIHLKIQRMTLYKKLKTKSLQEICDELGFEVKNKSQ